MAAMAANVFTEISRYVGILLACVTMLVLVCYCLCLTMLVFYRLQEARLQLLTKLLKQREQNHAELNIKRLDKMWKKKQKEKEAFIQKVRHEHIRCKLIT